MPGAQIKTNKCTGIWRGVGGRPPQEEFNSLFLPIVSVSSYTYINLPEREQYIPKKNERKKYLWLLLFRSGSTDQDRRYHWVSICHVARALAVGTHKEVGEALLKGMAFLTAAMTWFGVTAWSQSVANAMASLSHLLDAENSSSGERAAGKMYLCLHVHVFYDPVSTRAILEA